MRVSLLAKKRRIRKSLQKASEAVTDHGIDTILWLLKILDAVKAGYTSFINGCMAGWDILAAEAVLQLRTSHSEIKSCFSCSIISIPRAIPRQISGDNTTNWYFSSFKFHFPTSSKKWKTIFENS